MSSRFFLSAQESHLNSQFFMKIIRLFTLFIFPQFAWAQQGTFAVSASSGLLYQNSEIIFTQPGFGVELYGQYHLRDRVYAITSLLSYNRSTFPYDVDMSPDPFIAENGQPSFDSHEMPHRMREHLFSLGPWGALNSDYTMSQFLTFGLGAGARLMNKKRIKMDIALLATRLKYSDIRLNVNETLVRNGEFVSFEYDYTFWNRKIWGGQLKNSIVFPVTTHLFVSANVDWFLFDNRGTMGGWTRSFAVMNVGLQLSIPHNKQSNTDEKK